MIDLKNYNILITGAASGIGKATTLLCLSLGAHVFAFDKDKEGLSKLSDGVSSAAKYIDNLSCFTVDLSKQKEIDEAFKNVILNLKSKQLNGLVNCAGIYLGKSVFTYSEKEIDLIFDVNVKAPILLSKLFVEHIKTINLETENQTGDAIMNVCGSIVNVSSVSGQEGSSDAIYGTSKAALLGLTKSTAINFAPNIRVNAIAPGIVKTPMMKNISLERLAEYQNHELLENFITPENVAKSIVFLLSDDSAGITGSTIDQNNGVYLR